MKKLIPFLAFTCLTIISFSSGIPVNAGGCNKHKNKNVKIECVENDNICLKNKLENSELGTSIYS